MNINEINSIKHLIEQGEIKMAIEKLLIATDKLRIHKEVSHQSSKFATLKKEKRLGIVSQSESELKLNKITLALLSILEDLRNEVDIHIPPSSKPKKKTGVNNWNKGFIFFLFLVVFTTSLYIYISNEKIANIKITGRYWTINNLDVKIGESFCHPNIEKELCKKWGHLYTWEEAKQACKRLGKNWRLPTEIEWRELAIKYGGLQTLNETIENPEKAYLELSENGSSGLNLLKAGWFDIESLQSKDINRFGYYWSSSKVSNDQIWVFDLDGDDNYFDRDIISSSQRISCRCVKNIN